ncbi:MAG: hypothetical protein ACC628_10960 [Pirellulaceae bacterium]
MILPTVVENAERIHRLTVREYEATLDYWEKQFPEKLAVEVVGNSLEKAPLHLLKVTDGTVDDTDRQICLITSLDTTPRSGKVAPCRPELKVIDWEGNSPCPSRCSPRT